ncbi:Uncharacterised protein [Mycobacteroides abscessus subsp. abscessus]|nr:Uncharacterised protein [Mycobacteroides abscessus subsp. abscessus]
MAAISKAPLYPCRCMAEIHRGLTTRARKTRLVSSESVRVRTASGRVESPMYASGDLPVSARTVATIPPWYWK